MTSTGETPKNGSYVTWRELNLSLSPVHEKLDDITTKMNMVLDERIEHRVYASARTNRKQTIRFWITISATLCSGAFLTIIALSAGHL